MTNGMRESSLRWGVPGMGECCGNRLSTPPSAWLDWVGLGWTLFEPQMNTDETQISPLGVPAVKSEVAEAEFERAGAEAGDPRHRFDLV